LNQPLNLCRLFDAGQGAPWPFAGSYHFFRDDAEDTAMISIEDCIALCDLTREEVDAVAEHEHLPEAAASALASWLMENEDTGVPAISDMLRDDVRAAIKEGNHAHAAELLAALRHFLAEHPRQ
jgi:hypothetical protein